jgi:hypothetical protein
MTFHLIVNREVVLFWVEKRIVATIDKPPNDNLAIGPG